MHTVFTIFILLSIGYRLDTVDPLLKALADAYGAPRSQIIHARERAIIFSN